MSFDTTSIVYVTFEAITGFVTVVGNTVVFMAIVKTRQLHTVTNVFIGNLAVADILVGLFVAPLAALSFIGLPKDVFGCIFINCAILIFTNVSILMLLGVAVERFIAIRLPFAYDRILTIRRALWINVLIWILGCLLGLIPMYGWNIAPDRIDRCSFLTVISYEYMVYFQFFGLVVLPVLAMLLIYLYIFSVIRKHIQRNDTLQNMFRGDRRSRSKWNKEVRAAKSFALLIFLFAVCWMPVNILNSIKLFCETCSFPYPLLLTAIVMSHANSSINPILYATSNSRIQSSIKSMFGFKQGSDESSVDVPSGKMASMAARLGQPTSFHKNNDISVIAAGNGLENTLKHLGTPTCQSSPPNGITSPCGDGFPELKQLSPKLLQSIEDSEKDSEADIRFSNGSVVEHAQDRNGLPSHDQQVPNDRMDLDKNSSKYNGDYTSNNGQNNKTSHEHTTPMPPVSPKKFLGHINFAFADDALNVNEIPASTSCSQRTYETFNSVHNDDSETNNHDASERRSNNEKGDCRAEKDPATGTRVRGHKATKVFVNDVTRSPKIFGEAQDVVDKETVRSTPRHSPMAHRDAGLFPMEDEPAGFQEFNNKITFVTSEMDVVGNGGEGDGVEREKEDAQTTVTHSYFRAQNNKSRSSNVTDVEINAADFIACAESYQTKL